MKNLDSLLTEYRNNPSDENREAFFSAALAFTEDFCRKRSIPEDVSQEALIDVYRKLDTFKGDSSVDTWVTKIIRRRFSKYIEQKNRDKGTISLSYADSCEQVEEHISVMDSHLSIDEFGKLTADEKEIVNLRLQGYTDVEIAKQLRITKQSVGRRFAKMAERLKNLS